MNSSARLQATNTSFGDRWSLAPNLPVRRDARSMLIAVATGDGARVDCNFEDAEAFLLYEQDGCRTCFIGCQPCPLASGASVTNRARLLADCDLVLCANVSDICKQSLLELGVDCNLAFAGAIINDAVAALKQDLGN